MPRRGKRIVVILFLIVLVIGIGYGIKKYRDSKKTSSPTITQSTASTVVSQPATTVQNGVIGSIIPKPPTNAPGGILNPINHLGMITNTIGSSFNPFKR
jgi:hypothetical protein